jgi:hypothetical protein
MLLSQCISASMSGHSGRTMWYAYGVDDCLIVGLLSLHGTQPGLKLERNVSILQYLLVDVS